VIGSQSRADTIGSATCELVSMGVASVEQRPAAAPDRVAEGLELIELCGAFGGAGLAAVVKVVKAVDGRVPIGGVFYGCEASSGLDELFG
jgi:hypothetical protein